MASTAGPAETADALLAATRASTSSRLRICPLDIPVATPPDMETNAEIDRV